MLIASIATIGTAPFSVQQQERQGPEQDRTPGPTITSGNIVDDTIVSADLKDGEAVRSEDIVDGQVSNEDLADDAVTSEKIADGEVTSDDIAPGTIPTGGGGTPDDNSVTSATIVDGEVKSADIGDGEVTTADIANDAIKPQIQRVRGSFTAVAPGTIGFATADCPAGTILSGGGFEATTPTVGSSSVVIIASYPASDSRWQATGHNENRDINKHFAAYALCIGPSP